MTRQVQQNFLFIWILVLLSMALVLSLTFTGCSSNIKLNPENNSPAAASPAATPTGSAVSIGCSDTDGGQDTNVKGIITAKGETKDDTCVGPFLVEYYCDGDVIANKNIKCECSKGKCVTT